jgi:hypothetical protein
MNNRREMFEGQIKKLQEEMKIYMDGYVAALGWVDSLDRGEDSSKTAPTPVTEAESLKEENER